MWNRRRSLTRAPTMFWNVQPPIAVLTALAAACTSAAVAVRGTDAPSPPRPAPAIPSAVAEEPHRAPPVECGQTSDPLADFHMEEQLATCCGPSGRQASTADAGTDVGCGEYLKWALPEVAKGTTTPRVRCDVMMMAAERRALPTPPDGECDTLRALAGCSEHYSPHDQAIVRRGIVTYARSSGYGFEKGQNCFPNKDTALQDEWAHATITDWHDGFLCTTGLDPSQGVSGDPAVLSGRHVVDLRRISQTKYFDGPRTAARHPDSEKDREFLLADLDVCLVAAEGGAGNVRAVDKAGFCAALRQEGFPLFAGAVNSMTLVIDVPLLKTCGANGQELERAVAPSRRPATDELAGFVCIGRGRTPTYPPNLPDRVATICGALGSMPVGAAWLAAYDCWTAWKHGTETGGCQ